MLSVFTTGKPDILLAGILLIGCLIAGGDVAAVDFDPFGSGQAVVPASAENVTDEGPIIPQVEFNNNDISMAFQIISDATGWSIFPTAEVSRAKISLWAKSITAKELLETVVTMAGFIYHRQRDIITVMTYDEYMQYYGLGKQVICLSHADAASVAAVTKQFLTGLGKSVVHRETNTILLFESEANLKIIVGIVEKLDVPTEAEIGLEVIDLKYTDAEVLAETLQKVFSESKSRDTLKSSPTEKQPPADSDKRITQPHKATEDVLLRPQSRVAVYSIGRTNQIIVKARRNDIKTLKKLVEKLDTYTEPTSKSYHFTYVDAAEIYTGLELILNVSGRDGSSRRSGQPGRQADDRHEGIILVEKTNSILLTGPPSMHRVMASIVESSDRPGAYEAGMIRVYKLENADVKEVAQTIQELLKSDDKQKEKAFEIKYSGESVAGSSGATDSAGMAETEEFVPQIETRVSVSKSTNSIVVQATARQHRELEKLIEQLDERRKQVLIEARIVEVVTSDDLDVGTELTRVGDSVLAFTSFGLSAIDAGSGAREIIVSPGGTAAVLEPDDVEAILHALQSSANARITSAPQVLVNDNSTAVINSVQEEPITQLNASDTVATTSFAGFVEAGTTFAITPHISEKDYLRVEYEITLNAFETSSTDNTIPPPRRTTGIRSEATVPNESTIVVGGLQDAIQSRGVDKVPLLGDIPLIGYAFRRTIEREQYKTTYLFITPSIMKCKDFTDLKDASQKLHTEIEEDIRCEARNAESF